MQESLAILVRTVNSQLAFKQMSVAQWYFNVTTFSYFGFYCCCPYKIAPIFGKLEVRVRIRV